MKYLAFLLGLGACFFDPKAAGPSSIENPQAMDSGAAGNDGNAGAGGRAGEGGGGTGAISGMGGAGSGGAGVGGMSGGGAGTPPPPPLLANGEGCTEASRCKSGHCDGICCDKGAECCKSVNDCTMQAAGMGMACEDPPNCQGSAGALMCTDFKCVTMNGVPNDTACSNRTEASGCDYYEAVFCLGGEVQPGAPPCPTSCASDDDCDLDGHCDATGKCVGDLGNGEPCRRGTDCTQGVCQHVKNGVGICCGVLGDCCKAPTDCPAEYREAPACEKQTCSGTEVVAECNGNICSSKPIVNDAACTGMPGPDCGLYKDIVCMAGRDNRCRTSCMSGSDCDTATAFCDAGRCVAKRPNGDACNNTNQCMSGNCKSNICCSANAMECCKTPDDCKMISPLCDQAGDTKVCQGSRRMATCVSFVCSYSMNRIDDDSACTTGGSVCGSFKDVTCNGKPVQQDCMVNCTKNDDCDPGYVCADQAGQMKCIMPATTSSPAGGGASGEPG